MVQNRKNWRALAFVYFILKITGLFPIQYKVETKQVVRSRIQEVYSLLIIACYLFVLPKFVVIHLENVCDDHLIKFKDLIELYTGLNYFVIALHLIVLIFTKQLFAYINSLFAVFQLSERTERSRLFGLVVMKSVVFVLVFTGNLVTVMPVIKRRGFFEILAATACLIPPLVYALLQLVILMVGVILTEAYRWIDLELERIVSKWASGMINYSSLQRLEHSGRVSESVDWLLRNSSEVHDLQKQLNRWSTPFLKPLIVGYLASILSMVRRS
jgi:7tm Chemosensory receptor